ncbi:MAG: DUF6434 domain-containing protein [Actinomycetota bacterium]
MNADEQRRPEPTAELSGAEFRRWYWLKTELVAFARLLGVASSGNKPELADRIAAHLDGAPPPDPPPRRRTRSRALPEPLGADTVIPPRQAATQQLRRYFESEIGHRFHYDVFMRTFLAESDGRATLGDAVAHWHATRDAERPETPASLEFVRFSRQWHQAHPGRTAEQCRAAWAVHRSLPVDRRPGPTA